MTQPQPTRRPSWVGMQRLPNNCTLSTSQQDHILPNMTNSASVGPMSTSPNKQPCASEAMSSTSPSLWPALLPPSYQRNTSPRVQEYGPTTVRPATTVSHLQIQMPEQTPPLSRVVTDLRSNTPGTYRTHIATLRNGVPQKRPSSMFNGTNGSHTHIPTLRTSRGPTHKARPLVEDEDGDFVPLPIDHRHTTELTPSPEHKNYRKYTHGTSRSVPGNINNSAGTGRLEGRFHNPDSAHTSTNQYRGSPAPNQPGSENARSNTVESFTELKYPLVPDQLQGVRNAIGEDSWGVYVELIQHYVLGDIDESELEKEVAQQFLMSDDAAGRRLRKLTEKMVKDNLEADRCQEHMNTD